jgi:NADH dehydrogenase FAD-containing subunit
MAIHNLTYLIAKLTDQLRIGSIRIVLALTVHHNPDISNIQPRRLFLGVQWLRRATFCDWMESAVRYLVGRFVRRATFCDWTNTFSIVSSNGRILLGFRRLNGSVTSARYRGSNIHMGAVRAFQIITLGNSCCGQSAHTKATRPKLKISSDRDAPLLMFYLLQTALITLRQAIDLTYRVLTAHYFQPIQGVTPRSQAMSHIVILGGSYAGVSTAHRLLKHAAKLKPFKITLVSPNTDMYWNMASPRGIIPGQFTDEQLFRPIDAGFSQHPASQFEFILASAESLDVEAKKVVIVGSGETRTLEYDFLIIATGSRTRTESPFKGQGSTEETKKLLHEFQEKVRAASTIVVAGAGVTGVETAGELGFEYGRQKEIILVRINVTLPSHYQCFLLSMFHCADLSQLSSGLNVLEGTPPSVSSVATKALQSLNVAIKPQTKALSTVELPNGRKELTLSSGDTIITDMYIPTFGLIPNSSFVPANFLNPNGFVMVDGHLNLKGVTNVWALGDISEIEHSQFITCDRQSVYVAKSLVSVLGGKTSVPYKIAASRKIP